MVLGKQISRLLRVVVDEGAMCAVYNKNNTKLSSGCSM
jgi:hypothetical protein